MATSARRHYRTARRNAEFTNHPMRGLMAVKKHRPLLVAGIIGFFAVAFLNGLVIGLLFSKNK